MNCIYCKDLIDMGEEYILLSGYEYCGTQCIVDHFKAEGELEELIREDQSY